jgi:hypothetical protein
MDPEFEKLVNKAKTFGIDIDLIFTEFDHRMDAKVKSKVTEIARQVVDKIPEIKPNIEELAQAVAGKIEVGKVDYDALSDKILAKMPDTSAVERQQIKEDLSQQLAGFMTNYEQNLQIVVQKQVEAALMNEKTAMIQAVRGEMDTRMQGFMTEVKEGMDGSGNGKSKGKWDIPWDQILEFMKSSKSQDSDPLAGIDKFLDIRRRVLELEPAGPDINQQFRTASSSFLEGIKLGAKVKGSGGSDVKKSSGLPGGPSKSPARSSGLHPAIEGL